MDFTASEEQRLISDALGAFVERELYPHEAEVERLGTVPDELAKEIRPKAPAAGFSP
ncbi:MAG: acyl-CoA dehydrogenase, partial [Proteobacteria bacterium]|nr:acyl-CoA dehydrogenase [Pseudomonadota bacterium]